MAVSSKSSQSKYIIQAFAESVVNTFEQMCALDVEPGAPFIKASGSTFYGMTGIIGLSGDGNGVVVLTLSEDLGPKAVGRIAGEAFANINANVVDGVKELTNIIVGRARSELQSKGMDFSISLPKVVVGQNFITEIDANTKSIVIPFNSSLGEFYLEVCIKRMSQIG